MEPLLQCATIDDDMEAVNSVKNEDIYEHYTEGKVLSCGRYGVVWEAERC